MRHNLVDMFDDSIFVNEVYDEYVLGPAARCRCDTCGSFVAYQGRYDTLVKAVHGVYSTGGGDCLCLRCYLAECRARGMEPDDTALAAQGWNVAYLDPGVRLALRNERSGMTNRWICLPDLVHDIRLPDGRAYRASRLLLMYSESYGVGPCGARGFFVGRLVRSMSDGEVHVAHHDMSPSGQICDSLLWKDEGLGLFAGHVFRGLRHNNLLEPEESRELCRNESISTYGLVDNASELRMDQPVPGESVPSGVRNVTISGQWIPPHRRTGPGALVMERDTCTSPATPNLGADMKDSTSADGTAVIGGRTYRTVTIGGMTWMAENLRVDVEGSFAPDSEYEDRYGRLYTWDSAVKAAAEAQGWHLPSRSEWKYLSAAVGGTTAGTKLKDKTFSGGTDDYGFSVLPAGFYHSGSFYNVGILGGFWASTENSRSYAYYRYFSSGASMYPAYSNKKLGYSVRLVKDR